MNRFSINIQKFQRFDFDLYTDHVAWLLRNLNLLLSLLIQRTVDWNLVLLSESALSAVLSHHIRYLKAISVYWANYIGPYGQYRYQTKISALIDISNLGKDNFSPNFLFSYQPVLIWYKYSFGSSNPGSISFRFSTGSVYTALEVSSRSRRGLKSLYAPNVGEYVDVPPTKAA